MRKSDLGSPTSTNYLVLLIDNDGAMHSFLSTTDNRSAVVTYNYLKNHGEKVKLLTVFNYE